MKPKLILYDSSVASYDTEIARKFKIRENQGDLFENIRIYNQEWECGAIYKEEAIRGRRHAKSSWGSPPPPPPLAYILHIFYSCFYMYMCNFTFYTLYFTAPPSPHVYISTKSINTYINSKYTACTLVCQHTHWAILHITAQMMAGWVYAHLQSIKNHWQGVAAELQKAI